LAPQTKLAVSSITQMCCGIYGRMFWERVIGWFMKAACLQNGCGPPIPLLSRPCSLPPPLASKDEIEAKRKEI
jgi:hypothetical protein